MTGDQDEAKRALEIERAHIPFYPTHTVDLAALLSRHGQHAAREVESDNLGSGLRQSDRHAARPTGEFQHALAA
jgi:hypothetical protein